jgi:hypothetical protein
MRPGAPRYAWSRPKCQEARTSSIAIEGTSARITRRKAFAMETSVPSSRNSQYVLSSFRIVIDGVDMAARRTKTPS